MLESITDSLSDFLVMLFRHEVGPMEFYVSVGCTLLTMIAVARLLAKLFGRSKGMLVAALAVLLPLLFGAVSYVTVELYLVPLFAVDWVATYVPWAAFAVAGLLVARFLSAKLWGVGKRMAVLLLILSGLAGGAAYYGAQMLLGVVDRGGDPIELREERRKL
jgi:hypothetical protein